MLLWPPTSSFSFILRATFNNKKNTISGFNILIKKQTKMINSHLLSLFFKIFILKLKAWFNHWFKQRSKVKNCIFV